MTKLKKIKEEENLQLLVGDQEQQYSPNSCYILASGIPSFTKHVEISERYFPGYLPPSSVNHFIKDNLYGLLASFGVTLVRGKTNFDKSIIKKFNKMIRKYMDTEGYSGVNLTLDSGGYQVQQPGYIEKKDLFRFSDCYHEFLEENNDTYSSAFVLDVAPGAFYSIVDSWKEMEDYNRKTYTDAASLSESVRKKLLYIHHFRTPRIRSVFSKLLFNERLADPFDNFATGGMVSFSKSNQTFPIVPYTIPLVDIITYAKQRGIHKFRFHALGATEFKDFIGHKLFQKHIKKIHDIDVQITVDSSTVFQSFMLGRYLYIFDGDSLFKMTMRENLIHTPWRNKGTCEEVFYNNVNEFSKIYGFKELSKENEPIYVDGNITKLSYIYGTFSNLRLYRQVDNLCQKWADQLYPLYENGQYEEFDRIIGQLMMKFNNGKISKTVDSRTASISNSLKLLEILDMDYCDYLVDTFMAVDECSSLIGVDECKF